MAEEYNVYCDESCHLENDHKPVMAIAAVWCPLEQTRHISNKIREIKLRHGLSKFFEIKWTKVSVGKMNFYLDLLRYFFEETNLHFRAVVIPNKDQLNHRSFQQSHDDWYYKMFFVLLKEIINPKCSYRIYIDIKDTQSEMKRSKLEKVLRNCNYDSTGRIIDRIQQIQSHESQIMQFTDLLVGALRYHNEHLAGSKAKLVFIQQLKKLSRKSLFQTTWPKEEKFNILRWQAGGGEF